MIEVSREESSVLSKPNMELQRKRTERVRKTKDRVGNTEQKSDG